MRHLSHIETKINSDTISNILITYNKIIFIIGVILAITHSVNFERLAISAATVSTAS